MSNVRKGTVYINKPKNKNKSKDKSQTEKQLSRLASETKTVILRVSSVFPFQLFPDEIILDRTKVTIVRRFLFFKRIFPILYEDIRTTRINRGLVFASIEIELSGYERNPNPVTHLWPEKAIKVENYIMGMLKTLKDGVDLTGIGKEELAKRIENVGESQEDVIGLNSKRKENIQEE